MNNNGDTSAINRGRLRWRASRHALLELDILFRRFLDAHYERLDDNQLAALEELLTLEDHDIWDMVSGRKDCSVARWRGLIDVLRTS